MKEIQYRGKFYACGTKLKQYDEDSEDGSLLGNTGDFADNFLTIADFRTRKDCQYIARILNQELKRRKKNEPKKSHAGLR